MNHYRLAPTYVGVYASSWPLKWWRAGFIREVEIRIKSMWDHVSQLPPGGALSLPRSLSEF